uniref:Ethanolaminephosphotransferase n=1 Tax=Attheya septentrionalis TaxID=420275 RepID=A0A7S2UBC5_9STRA|mmetsp:Transcript_18522/g.33542  ORF Transcript_18522/g.33542 Transcript_18522/m.33542 type:complete len:444 (+) Transcript_18522:197-1528(+)
MTASSKVQNGAKPHQNGNGVDCEISDQRGYRGYYYMTESAADALPKFKYSGEDCSLIYKHILSPLANYLVHNWTPKTIAPNTITIVALLHMVASYGLVWFYCPKLADSLTGDGEEGTNVPGFVFLFSCVTMLIYQTLDNMDGKHAVRMKAASPLGLLFDHGCDAVNSVFGSANGVCALGLSASRDPVAVFVSVIFPMATFYVATWEEYHTGHLLLPIINGPNEGLVAGASFSLISFIWGVQYWHETSWFDRFIEPYSSKLLPSTVSSIIPDYGIRNVDLIFYICVVWLIQEETLKIYQVARKYGASSLKNLLPYIFLMASSTYIGAYYPEFLARNTRVCLNLVSALFSEMVIQLMLDHMSKEPYTPYRLTLIPLVVLIIMLHINLLSDTIVDEYVLTYAVVAWTYLLMKVRFIINEMCTLLRIWCFDIHTPYPMSEITTQKLN